MPKKGILLILQCSMAAIFPSFPLFPITPGIKTPSTFFNLFLIYKDFELSESILIRFTFKLFLIPPCTKASSKDL